MFRNGVILEEDKALSGMLKVFAVILCAAFALVPDAAAQQDRVTVCADAGAGGYEAFPDVCRLADGRLLAVFYAGYGHVSLPTEALTNGGRISYCLSSDEGQTWSAAQTLFDGPFDDRDPSITQLKDGRLICTFFTLQPAGGSAYVGLGTFMVTSSDRGATWDTVPQQISASYYGSSPVRELSDGRLMLGLYKQTTAEAWGAVTVSENGGATWSAPVIIPNGGLRYEAETDVIERKDGSLFAALRGQNHSGWSVSSDGGLTWSTATLFGFPGHCHYLHRAPGDIIVMAFRWWEAGNTSLRYSLDECQTWSTNVVVDSVLGAYPSMVSLRDGSVLIVYYDEGTGSNIRAKRFRVTSVGVEWLSLTPACTVQVLYTAENDSLVATDQLTGDGAQNGVFTRTGSNDVKSVTADVYVTNSLARFGLSAFAFTQTASYVNTLDIEGVTSLGPAFTLAAYVRPSVVGIRHRIFSTYSSSGGTAGQLLFDFGTQLNGMRLAVNGVGVMPDEAGKVTIPANIYSHLAATYDDGAVRLYLNGLQVWSGTAGAGPPVIDFNAGRSIQVGEDFSFGGGNVDQMQGAMDDILIYDRALTSDEIGGLAFFGAEVFLAERYIHKGILYTAEGDITNATDRLRSDASQDGNFSSTNVTVSAANPRFGASAYRFSNPAGTAELKTIELPGTKTLGKYFTLAAYVDAASVVKQRLFSSYLGGGAVGGTALVFEFDLDGNAENFTMRFNHNGIMTAATTNFADGAYHHLALTYEDGEVTLYLDGAEVGSGTHPSGAVAMTYDLRVGEDWGGPVNEQLVGDVDDIVVLRKVLTAAQIALLKELGGQRFLVPLPPSPKGTRISLE